MVLNTDFSNLKKDLYLNTIFVYSKMTVRIFSYNCEIVYSLNKKYSALSKLNSRILATSGFLNSSIVNSHIGHDSLIKDTLYRDKLFRCYFQL